MLSISVVLTWLHDFYESMERVDLFSGVSGDGGEVHVAVEHDATKRLDSDSELAGTRNSTLDNLLVGHSLGAEPMSKDVMAKKLMFGVLRHDLRMDKFGTMGTEANSDIDHASFCLCDEVVRIKRGHAIS